MKKEHVPRWPLRLLEIVCPDHLLEEIEGNLKEKFHSDRERLGLRRAKQIFVWRTLGYFRPGILLRRRLTTRPRYTFLLGIHLKVAIRQIIKAKYYSVLNIAGLSVAFATAFLILLYLQFQLSFDHVHANQHEIFRVVSHQHENSVLKQTSAKSFYGVGTILKENFPEIKNVTRFYRWPASTGILMMSNGNIYNERNYVFADCEFFKVFPSLLIRGDASTCLSNPNSIVISKKLALKIFNTDDVIGKTVRELDKKRTELVFTGLIIDLPKNVHFDLDVVRPRDWVPDTQWEYINDYTYVTLVSEISVDDLESKLNEVVQKARKDDPSARDVSLSFQHISDVHLNPQDTGEIKTGGNKNTVYLVGMIFIIVLLVAWVNQINFETSQFVGRIKEVAVRRIIGSSKRDLIIQFFTQYTCVHLLAIFFAAIIVWVALPYFNFVTGVPIQTISFNTSPLLLTSLSFFLARIIVTGIYPVLILANTDLMASLKGKLTRSINKTSSRSALAIFQYTSALTVTGILIIVSQQIDFMRNVTRNINTDKILTVYNSTNYSAYEDSLRGPKNGVFKETLLSNPGIENFTSSSAIPGEPIGFTYVDLAKRSMNDPDRQIPYKVVYIDYDFIPVFNLKLKAGRNYDPRQTDAGCLVITESTARNLGFASAEDAVNREIFFMEDAWDTWKIIGVVEDYRHEAVKSSIYPTIFRLHRNQGQMVYYSVRIHPNESPGEAVDAVQKAWNATWPEKPFDYFFLNEFYDQQFKSEMNFERIFVSFASIAILIACLGLFGMTLMTVTTRSKEISIRKVLGATPAELVKLLSGKNLRAIAVASIVSMPFIYFLGMQWLSKYPARIDISFTAFVIPIGILMTMAALTSGIRTLHAASSNPTKHLTND